MKRILISLLAGVALAAAARAESLTFDFTDPKGVNNIVFLLDAPLESMNGTATGISGTASFDPAHPEATHGKIVVQTESLHVGNPKMNEHMMGGSWLDAKKYPEITFELKSLSDVSEKGGKIKATAHGVMTVRGVSKEMEAPITLSYLKDAMGQRMPNAKGDILVIRSNFTILRSDFGVNSGKMEDKVSDEVELRLSVAGFSSH